jgi:hypothetical protein
MRSIIAKAPAITEAYDTNTEAAHTYLNQVEEWVAGQSESLEELDKKARLMGDEAMAFRVMLKFLKSVTIIRSINQPVFITLVNPVYKETGRMQKREAHPHGENSLRTKVECLQYFEKLNPFFKGRVFVVDDGCPHGSGELAADILSEYNTDLHKVFFLERAIEAGDKAIPEGITVKSGNNRSVKGGAVLYGMKKALINKVEGLHIIVDNDADLSVHPMQLGLLIEDILSEKALVVAGSRRETDSVSLIGKSRNKRGNLFIKIWQHLLPQLAEKITDTNRAFKAFESHALEQILPSVKIYTFPYQIEVLQASISKNIPLLKKGIAYIDSEAASTQSGDNITETYLNQIHQIIDIATRYKAIDKNDPLLKFLSSISEEDWSAIEANPPENLEALISDTP